MGFARSGGGPASGSVGLKFARLSAHLPIAVAAPILLTLCVAASGCASSAALSMVPEGVEAAGVLSSEAMMRKQAGASGANSAGDAANNANQNANAMLMDEKNERCTQLVDNLPIVEEIRLAARGGFEVRQWTVGGNGTGQQWRVVYVKGASQAGWQRKSSLANLDFHPALADHLVPGKSCYLAFAPAQPRTLAEGDRQAATVMSFGAAVGTFKWNGRIYDYSLADKLPCFEIAE